MSSGFPAASLLRTPRVMERFPLLSQNRLFVFFTAVCVAVNMLAYVLYSHNQKILQSQEWVNHSYEVTRQTQQELIYLLGLMSAHKNYMIMGRAQDLEQFKEAKRNLDIQQTLLHRLVDDNLDQQLGLKSLARQIDSLHERMRNQAIRRSQVSLPRTISENQAAIDNLRGAMEDFITKEATLLKERVKLVSVKREDFFHILLLSSGLSIVGLLITIVALTTLRTQQEKMEEKLAESQEQIMLAMRGLNDGIFDFNVERGSMYHSPRLKEMLGYAPEDSLPMEIDEFRQFIHPDDRAGAIETARKYFERELPTYLNFFRIKAKDGRYRWIMSRGQGLWGKDGKIRRLVGAYTDITDQKTIEENLRHSKEELENFTYIASHDLRSPLVNLKGFATEMARSVEEAAPLIEQVAPALPQADRERVTRTLREEIPEALHYIQTAVSRMDRLTNAILDLQRIGKRRLRFETISTQDLMQRSIDILAHEIQSKGIQVELGHLPELRSDAIALEQVFGNLLDNAVKYLDPVRPGRIYVAGRRLHGDVLFEVADNGRGIAESEKDKVFEFFRRASNAGEVRGEGMGMAFVKSTVNRLGGRIWFTSTPGVGTTFYFTVNEEPPND